MPLRDEKSSRTDAPRPSKRRRPRFALAALSGVVLAGTLTALSANSAHAGAPPALAANSTRTPATADRVQQSLDKLVQSEYPGALAAVRGRDGRTRHYTAGVGDVKTKAKVPVNGRVRIASNTKMFTATVVLQLVGEGKVELDAPIEKYLPNLVRGDGIDGRKITVRQILQHTSGLADYDEEIMQGFPESRHTYYEPRELLDVGMGKKALFAPGKGWSYSNTNYILAGLLIQKVTGRPVAEEITRRVIDRAGLRQTYWPAVGDQTIRGPHPKGYFAAKPGEPWVDVTDIDPSTAWAAGQLISTPSDVNAFLTSLLGGGLLKPRQLEQMKTTVAAPDFDVTGGARYGLGIGTFKLSCGGFAWTHGGNAPGYSTMNAVTGDGRAATVAVTALPTSLPAAQHHAAALDTALCAG
ncbi:serine hydrolase domain-containing protein [Actinomadura vinacea]|uniref:Serine hydrolase domain-containing protein n=1 Tax=Actinomadura vinacea TaxID=115336 RepID=A0ABN3IFV1_9ACTN